MLNILHCTCQQAYNEALIAKLFLSAHFTTNNTSTEKNEESDKRSISVHFKDLLVINASLGSWVMVPNFLYLLAYVSKAVFRYIRKMKYKFRI